MMLQTIPGLDQITTLLLTGFILLVGLVILVLVVKVVLHFFLAIVAGLIVWYFTGGYIILGALTFLAVAILTTGKRKQTVVYPAQSSSQSVGKICPNCKLALAQDARFCPNCGRSV
jgi:uncharacterized membrane protein YedE/YeeE